MRWLRAVAAARSHTGLVRASNEDTVVCDPERGLFAVIDGMGGEAAGEVAAAIARDALLAHDDLATALVYANDAILARGDARPTERGMGCVVTAARLGDAHLELAHVGDTRAYLASKGGCEQLTRDHTVRAEAQAAWGLADGAAAAVAGGAAVTRDLGGRPRADASFVDRRAVAVAPGDLLVLSSDGLHDLVSGFELAVRLQDARRRGEAPADVADRLVALALERGGRDNVSVVVVQLRARWRGSWRLAAWAGAVPDASGEVG